MPEKWPDKWPRILLCTLLKLHISTKVEKFNVISLTEIKVNEVALNLNKHWTKTVQTRREVVRGK